MYIKRTSYLRTGTYFEVSLKHFLMNISKECNGKTRVKYELFKKQWLITGIFIEKAKKVINVFTVWK